MKTYGPERRLIEPKDYRKRTGGIFGVSWIGLLNLTAVGILMAAIIMLFAGYPIYDWLSTPTVNVSSVLPFSPLTSADSMYCE